MPDMAPKTLEATDLGNLGAFTEAPCGFRIDRYHLEEPWPYIFATPELLLRVDQRGPDFVQLDPPGGTVLVRRERFQAYPSWFVWIRIGEERAFTNFWLPVVGFDPASEPDEFRCEYSAGKTVYRIVHDSILCETELSVCRDEASVSLACTVQNLRDGPGDIEMLPVMRPHFAAASLAPWDVPALYQRVSCCDGPEPRFDLELRSPAGDPSQRQRASVTILPLPLRETDGARGTSTSAVEWDEIGADYSAFLGGGTFEHPEALAGRPFGSGRVNGVQGIIALRKRLRLEPGDSFGFVMTAGRPDGQERPRHDGISEMMSKRAITTPDPAFDRYVNEWLPLQLRWVTLLDRGWPTGMRGVRDRAQDATALIPLDTAASRATILEIFDIQRSDGWFPRQYSVKSRSGPHDLRAYVDGGVWVWEMLYDYLCFTRDFSIFREAVGFLDNDREACIGDHLRLLMDYYLDDANLGEHSLCLIREGDWNDSVNRAGLNGRGESVMVTCQVALMLRQAAGFFERVFACKGTDPDHLHERALRFENAVLSSALNEEGYLNGVFTDNGEWVFSRRDRDGARRVSIPVNAFGIISGVLRGEKADRALDVVAELKGPDGWPLFWPPIGDPPIDGLGRIGQGDLAPGLGENGTVYNHGSHGFLARAAAAAGRADLLIEVLRCMLPYDQGRHPVSRAKTAPYAMVNHYKSAPGLEGRGGDAFLTGSISTALRGVYNCLFGIKPTLEGLAIAPCLPAEWPECAVRCAYRDSDVEITFARTGGAPRLEVGDEEIASTGRDPATGRKYLIVPDSVFQPGRRHSVRWTGR